MAFLATGPLHAACENPTWTELTPVNTGQNPLGLAVADFNGDGISDIATPSTVSNNVRVRFGTASGALSTTFTEYDVGTEPIDIRAANMNGDPWIDLVTLNRSSGSVSVLLNDGSGSFAAAITTTVISNPGDFAIADFDGDGKNDVVAANTPNSNQITIFYGTGDGHFSALTTTLFATGTVWSLTAGDVTGDGKADIVAGTLFEDPPPTFKSHVEVFRNEYPTFPGNAYLIGKGEAYNTILADFDGDGDLDAAVTRLGGYSTILNNGSGVFSGVFDQTLSGPLAFIRIAALDMNEDGTLDLLVPSVGATTGQYVSRDTGFGNGTFRRGLGTTSSGFTDWHGAGAGDFNGDGRPDHVLISTNANRAVVFLNACTARYTKTTASSSPNPSAFGQAVTETATVRPRYTTMQRPTGTLRFAWEQRDANNFIIAHGESAEIPVADGPDNSATASYTWNNLPAGTLTMFAYYSGDSFYGTSWTQFSHQVQKPPFGAPYDFLAFGGGQDQPGAFLSWKGTQGVDHYEVWRLASGTWSLLATTTAESYVDHALSFGMTIVYKVRAIAPNATASSFTNPDPVTTYFDQPSPSQWIIYAVHLQDLRNEANLLRGAAGLPAATFTDPNPYEKVVRAVHFNQLRTAIDQARATIGLTPTAWAEPIVAGVTLIKQSHRNEIRNAATETP